MNLLSSPCVHRRICREHDDVSKTEASVSAWSDADDVPKQNCHVILHRRDTRSRNLELN